MTRDIALSPHALAVLGVDIARDGFASHEHTVSELVASLRRQTPRWSVVDVLADPCLPAAVRARALALVSRRRPGPEIARRPATIAGDR